MFLILLLGGVQSSYLSLIETEGLEHVQTAAPSLDHIVFISVTAATSLIAAAWMFFRVTGGLFNPAVTLATFLIGDIDVTRFALYFIAQVRLTANPPSDND